MKDARSLMFITLPVLRVRPSVVGFIPIAKMVTILVLLMQFSPQNFWVSAQLLMR